MYTKRINVKEFIFTINKSRCPFVLGEVIMFLFFSGLILGVIFGIVLIAILSSGAIADQWMENQLKEMDQFSSTNQPIITTKN
jgi:hypothetical protein